MQALIIPFIIFAGAAQALAAPMSGQLRVGIGNIWLASAIVFSINASLYFTLFAVRPLPLPTMAGLAAMPWWAPLTGLVGGFAGFAGLLFVDKIGAGALNGFLLSANLVASLAIDHYAVMGVPEHPINLGRAAGGLLLIAGIVLIHIF